MFHSRARSIGVLFALLFLVAFPAMVQAMHIIGGEITYECLGTVAPGVNRYRFTMKIYRDCDGGGAFFDNPAEIAIFRGTETNNVMIEDFQSFSPAITRLVPDTPDCVEKIPVTCVEQAVYVFQRDLPILSNESYFVVYQRCCRNESVKNLINSGDVGATYMVKLTPAAQAVCNNSPTFNNFPPLIICNNFPLEFDHSATDADGDQIFYSFCSPLNGGGPLLQPQSVLFSCDGAKPTPPCGPPFDNVPFAVPTFTPAAPMGGSPVITINPTTGMITGTPNGLGLYVVGVCIQEFRNGQLLSQVQREFQFDVADCSPTVLASIDADTTVGIQQYVIKACGRNTVTFQNQSVQFQNIDRFQWRFNLKGVPFVDSTNWNATVTFPDTGSYTGQLLLNPGTVCGDTAEIRVNIFPSIKANFDFEYDTCVAGPVNFTDLSTGEGVITNWSWNFGVPGGTSTEQNPEFRYSIPGDHPVRLRVTDKNGCSDDTVRVIRWFPAPPIIIVRPSSFLGCAPAEIRFVNQSTPIDSTYDIVWHFGDGGSSSGIISPTHLYENEGIYDVSVAITSPIGCFAADTFHNLIRVEPSPTADFTFDPSANLSNLNNTIQFTDLSSGANRWNWQFDRFGTTTQQNPSFTFPDTGLMKVRLIVTHPKGCQDSLTQELDIRPEIRWFMPNAFTPNGDGTNDGFLGKGFLFGATNFQMTIWNRWGELIFETKNPDEAWNGQALNSGGMAPAGVYVYLVSFTGPRGESFEFKGFATLVR